MGRPSFTCWSTNGFTSNAMAAAQAAAGAVPPVISFASACMQSALPTSSTTWSASRKSGTPNSHCSGVPSQASMKFAPVSVKKFLPSG